MDAVNLLEVTVAYGSHIALEKVTFSLKEGLFLAVMGPNGAGKTTLLRTMLGLAPLVEGSVKVFGVDVYERPLEVRRMVGYVPQKESVDATVPVLVKDVVLMGRCSKAGLLRPLTKEDYQVAKEALEQVGLGDLWDTPYVHLSGGQQQRVLIARALAQQPRLLLLDEPFSQIDYPSQRTIARLLRDLKEDEGTTIIACIHVLDPVIDFVDRVLLLNRRVLAYGEPEAVLKEEVLRQAYSKGLVFIPLSRSFRR